MFSIHPFRLRIDKINKSDQHIQKYTNILRIDNILQNTFWSPYTELVVCQMI